MGSATISPSAWKTVAEKRFASDAQYFDPEAEEPYAKFHEAFSEPADVYLELARRITTRTVRVVAEPKESALGGSNTVALRKVRESLDHAVEAGAYKLMVEAFNKDAELGSREHLMVLAEVYDALVREEDKG